MILTGGEQSQLFVAGENTFTLPLVCNADQRVAARIGFRKSQPSRSAMFNSLRSFSSSRLTAAMLRCFFAFVGFASRSARKSRISA